MLQCLVCLFCFTKASNISRMQLVFPTKHYEIVQPLKDLSSSGPAVIMQTTVSHSHSPIYLGKYLCISVVFLSCFLLTSQHKIFYQEALFLCVPCNRWSC